MSEGAQTTMVLTDGQAQTFNSLERMGASLSLIGVSLIFITFAACKRLRNLPNTFICMASVANVFASIACAIGYAGIWDLRKNPNSPLCQVQGLLFEWFMQSDPWWSVAMAINVFLVFFFSFTPDFFRKYLWLYGIICYGMPCIPGIVFLVYRNKQKGLIYGDAILWCWISPEWNYLRIASYYIPIWACISVSILIYFAVGYKVFRQRSQLRNLTLSNPAKQVSTNGSSDVRDSAEKNLTAQPGYLNTITTEVQVTTDTLPLGHHRRGSATPPSPSPTNLTTLTTATISGGQSTLVWSPSQHTDIQAYPTSSSMTANTISTFQTTSAIPSSAASAQPRSTSSDVQLKDGDNVAATSSHHEDPHSQGRSSNLLTLRKNPFSGLPAAWARFQQKLNNMDQVKLAYLRTSFIFAVSVLVTWTPSSINRVYSLIHPDDFSYGLNIAASVVLPLQGVWNAVIYFTTSWRIIREEWAVFRSRGGGALRRVSGEGGSRGGNAWGGGALGVPNMGRGRRIEDNDLELTPRVGTMRVVPGHGLDGGSI